MDETGAEISSEPLKWEETFRSVKRGLALLPCTRMHWL